MLDAIKKLLENKVIDEDMHTEIQDAWTGKLNEARENLRSELREEFAQRYDHDKTVMVEALDKMMEDGLRSEIAEFKEEKAALAEDRVKFNKKMTEHGTKFNNFMTAKLAEEIKELRKDRKIQNEGLTKIKKFVARHLAEEINEFSKDKTDLVETKVKLVAEAESKFNAIKKRFVAESSKKVKAHVSLKLQSELTALNEDIKAARENSFGRRIFEAYASEFTSTHLNENAVIRKLRSEVAEKNNKLKESFTIAKKFKQLNESKQQELRIMEAKNNRNVILDELLSPLNEEKKQIMQHLLENVQTNRLNRTFDKYLPAVLNNKKPRAQSFKRKTALTETKLSSTTGNKTAKPSSDDYNNNIVDIKILAGL